MESDRKKYVAEQEMKRKMAYALRDEIRLLTNLLKEKEESLAQAKQSTEIWEKKFQALCGEWFFIHY